MNLPKTHKTAVVLIPPHEVWAPIQHIRQRYDRKIRRWMPHITMIYPFCPRSWFDRLVEPFARVCQKFEPFEVTLRRFRYFSHGNARYTLWLAPEPAEPIIKLQHALTAVVPACKEVQQFPGGFTPHLSVGQVKGRAHLQTTLCELQHTWKPLSFVVKHVYFIWRNDPPDDVFRIGCALPLGKEAQGVDRCVPPSDFRYKPEETV